MNNVISGSFSNRIVYFQIVLIRKNPYLLLISNVFHFCRLSVLNSVFILLYLKMLSFTRFLIQILEKNVLLSLNIIKQQFSDPLFIFKPTPTPYNQYFREFNSQMCIVQGVEGIVKYGKACRRLILMEDGSEVRNFVANIKLFTVSGDTLVNLLLVLRFLSEKGAAIQGYEFQFVDQRVTVRSLFENVYVGVDNFAEHVVIINRKPIMDIAVEEEVKEVWEQNKVREEVQEEMKEMVKEEMLMEEQEREQEETVQKMEVLMEIEIEVEEMKQDSEHKSEKDESHSKSSKQEKQEGTEGSKEADKQKKQKEKERQIKNAIECVKVWRGIYEASNHKTSLMNAAKALGISKKSLDDYFLQIRLGQFYGFDFPKYMNKGIGVLRAFIKEKSNKELEKKVPKNIRSFDLVRDFDELKALMMADRSEEIGEINSNVERSKTPVE